MATERGSLSEIETSIIQLSESSTSREARFTEIEAVKDTDGFVEDPYLALELLREQEGIEGALTEEKSLLNSFKDKARGLMEPHISSARGYLDNLELRNLQMEEIRRHHLAGRLTDELMGRFEENYTQFIEEPNTNPDLGGTIRLLQLYPELAEKSIQPPVVPPDEGSRPKEPEKPFVLPDGQEVLSTRKEMQLGDILNEVYKLGDHLQTVSGEELVRKIWGEEVDIKVGKARLSVLITNFRKKLANKQWAVFNHTPLHINADGQYRFARMERIATVETIGRILTSLDEIEWENEPQMEKEVKFSAEEKAVLARLLINRSNSVIKINESDQYRLYFDEKELKACQKLYEAVYSRQEEPVNRHAEQLRADVLSKVEKVLKGEKAEEVILDTLVTDDDLATVLVGLFTLERAVAPSHLIEFLKAGLDPKAYSDEVYDWIRRAIRYEAERVQRVKYATETREPKPTIMFEKVENREVSDQREGEMSDQPVDKAREESINDQATPEVPKQSKQTDIEKRNPNVKEDVREIIDHLAKNHVDKPIGTPRLTQLFPRVKSAFVINAIENGFIRPDYGRDHHPAYKDFEQVILVYTHDHENDGGFTTRQLKELESIVKNEIKKNKAKQRGNGQAGNGHK